MSTEQNKLKKVDHWDKTKVYGYSDEEYLAGEPEDNTIPIEGNEEILTKEEIYRMFPNQKIFIRVIESETLEKTMTWTKAQVLWFHSTFGFAMEKMIEMGCPDDCVDWLILTDGVAKALLPTIPDL